MIEQAFAALGRFVTSRPRTVLLFGTLLAVLAAVLTAAHLELKTDQNDLVGADLDYNRLYLRFLDEFGDLEFLYVVVPVGDQPERAMEAVDAVAAELKPLLRVGPDGDPPLLEEVFYRVPPEALRYGVPFLQVEELLQIAGSVEDRAREVRALADIDSLASLFTIFSRTFGPGALGGNSDGGGSDPRSLAEWGFRILEATITGMEDVIAGRSPETFEEALDEAVALSPPERGYSSTRNGKLLLMEITPRKKTGAVEAIREPLAAVRAALERVRERFPGQEIGLTGRPVLQADEMATSARDMRIATIGALAGVFALFVIFFRRLRRPFFAVLTLVVAIVITFGVTTATIGYLTLLSIVFAAMLVGLGIDFGIHFLARYQDEVNRTDDVREAIVTTLRTTGVSIATGGLTTAAAFLAILFVDFQGLRELGFIAGVGVIICLVAMVTFLPALVVISDTRLLRKRKIGLMRPIRIPFLPSLARHARWTIAISIAITIAGLVRFEGLPYNPSIIDLQAQELESVYYEKLIIKESEFSTWFCAFTVDELGEIPGILERLEPGKEKGVFGQSESILTYVPENQERKVEVFRRIRRAIGDLEFSPPAPDIDRQALAASLDELLDSVEDLASAAVLRSEADAARELGALAGRIEAVGETLPELDPEQFNALRAYQVAWIGGLHHLLGGLYEALEPEPLLAGDLPNAIRRRFVSREGDRYLVYVYPKQNIWDEEPMEAFVRAVRDVDASATGAPIQVWESTWRMRDGFLLAALYSLVVTMIFLWLDLRRVDAALLAFLPLGVGFIWLLGSLSWIGLEFNLANFFTLPILIGVGIDGGVHIMHRFRETGSTIEVLRTTCSAVTLSFLTTIAGFGAMCFAHHRGIRSLGLMMVVGLAAVLVASVVLLPAVLCFIEDRRKHREESATAAEEASRTESAEA